MNGSGSRPDVGGAPVAPEMVKLRHVAAGAALVVVVLLAFTRMASGPRWHLPGDATDVTEHSETYQGLEGDYRYDLRATVSPEGFEEFVRSIGLTPGVPPDCAFCSGMSHGRQLGSEHCSCARYHGGRLEYLDASW